MKNLFVGFALLAGAIAIGMANTSGQHYGYEGGACGFAIAAGLSLIAAAVSDVAARVEQRMKQLAGEYGEYNVGESIGVTWWNEDGKVTEIADYSDSVLGARC